MRQHLHQMKTETIPMDQSESPAHKNVSIAVQNGQRRHSGDREIRTAKRFRQSSTPRSSRSEYEIARTSRVLRKKKPLKLP